MFTLLVLRRRGKHYLPVAVSTIMAIVCTHLETLGELKTARTVCEECIKTGDTWLHLRTCQECGVTLCCDSSPNRHASKHFKQTDHPVISSAQPGERWLWCYVDSEMAEY